MIELTALKKVRERINSHLYPDWPLQKKELEFAEGQFQSDLKAIVAELKHIHENTGNESPYVAMKRLISAIDSALKVEGKT